MDPALHPPNSTERGFPLRVMIYLLTVAAAAASCFDLKKLPEEFSQFEVVLTFVLASLGLGAFVGMLLGLTQINRCRGVLWGIPLGAILALLTTTILMAPAPPYRFLAAGGVMIATPVLMRVWSD